MHPSLENLIPTPHLSAQRNYQPFSNLQHVPSSGASSNITFPAPLDENKKFLGVNYGRQFTTPVMLPMLKQHNPPTIYSAFTPTSKKKN
jgi:hypothetical protein